MWILDGAHTSAVSNCEKVWLVTLYRRTRSPKFERSLQLNQYRDSLLTQSYVRWRWCSWQIVNWLLNFPLAPIWFKHGEFEYQGTRTECMNASVQSCSPRLDVPAWEHDRVHMLIRYGSSIVNGDPNRARNTDTCFPPPISFRGAILWLSPWL